MKNLAKFLLFVLLLSAGISLLYDYRLKHGGLKFSSGRTSEKYSFASEPAVNAKQVASLESLNEERRALVKSVIPAVVDLVCRRLLEKKNRSDPASLGRRSCGQS